MLPHLQFSPLWCMIFALEDMNFKATSSILAIIYLVFLTVDRYVCHYYYGAIFYIS